MLSCLYHSLIEQHSLDQGERICAGWGLIKRNENKDGDQNILLLLLLLAVKKVIL